MPIYKVKKRNGSICSFDRFKIHAAIQQAIKAAGGEDFMQIAPMTDQVIRLVESRVGYNIPSVEQIQDAVEEVLIKEGHDSVSKAYILYRQKQAESRSDKQVVVEVGKTMEEYLEKSDWRVNANANSGYSLG